MTKPGPLPKIVVYVVCPSCQKGGNDYVGSTLPKRLIKLEFIKCTLCRKKEALDANQVERSSEDTK